MDTLLMIVAGLFMISFLVVIHEAGHFVAARIFGVRVPVFSVFVGPTIFAFKWGDTEYRLGSLPLGGFVQLAGADAFGEEDADTSVPVDQRFMSKPIWQRLVIMAAGPGVNLALPFFLFTVLLMLGRPEYNSRVGAVLPGTPAEAAGFVVDDHIVQIDGEPVSVWFDVVERLQARAGTDGEVALRVERGGQEVDLSLPASAIGQTYDGDLDANGLGMRNVYLTARVGVEDGRSPAAQAGLRTGDYIRKVDGVDVLDWHQVMAALAPPPGELAQAHEITLARQKGVTAEVEELNVTLHPDPTWPRPAEPFGNAWGLAPAQVFAWDVDPTSAAWEAGVRPGDRFLRADGENVLTFDHFVDRVGRTIEHGGPPRPLQLAVVREGQVVEMTLTPRMKLVPGEVHERPIIGVTSYADTLRSVDLAKKYYGLVAAIPRAASESWGVIEGTVSMIRNLLSWKADPRENVGGPVSIFYVAGKAAEQGFFTYASFMGMISVSVGCVNLLPIPVLDGGQILFYLVELVRGRPLSLEIRERVQIVSLLGLAMLMLLVFVNDIHRISEF